MMQFSLNAPRFWWSWPSLLVELLSGLLVSTGLWWTLRWPGVIEQVTVGTAISLVYELVFDANDCSLKDVIQREVGILLGTLLWALLLGGR